MRGGTVSDLFKELRFLGLRTEDTAKVATVISEIDLRKEYNFTDFCKNNADEWNIVDLFEQGRAEQKLNSPSSLRHWREENKLALDGRKEVITCYSSENENAQSVYIKSSDNFTRKPKGPLLSAMKQWVSEKEKCFESLQEKYSDVLKENKTVNLLPISLKINPDQIKSPLSMEMINEKVSELTTAFTKLITKIKSRSHYSQFISYSRVILLDKNNHPYLHIILYYQKSNISDFFIRDLTRIWCEVCDEFIQTNSIQTSSFLRDKAPRYNDISLNYVIFNHPFPAMLNDEPEDDADWREGEYYKNNEKTYHFKITITHMLRPFNTIEPEHIIIPESLKKRHNSDLSHYPEAFIRRFSEVQGYSDEKELQRFVKHIEQDKKYHLYYLEQVAKQYIKIPNLNNMSSGEFSYKLKSKE